MASEKGEVLSLQPAINRPPNCNQCLLVKNHVRVEDYGCH